MINMKEVYEQQARLKAVEENILNKLGVSGGTVTGDLQVDRYLKLAAWKEYGEGSINIWANKNGNGTLDIDGAKDINIGDNLVYHAGRKPTTTEIGALPSGIWRISGQDLIVHEKRALVGTPDGILHVGYGNDFSHLKFNTNLIYHEGHKPHWSEIEGAPTSLPPSAHTHDDRYFTESEMNTKLNLKLSNAGGTITGAISTNNIIQFNKGGTGPVVANGTSRSLIYSSTTLGEHLFGGNNSSDSTAISDYLRVGINKLQYTTQGSTYDVFHVGHKPTWAEVDGKPSSFTPSSHTHDDRYYTESEMNTKLTAKVNTSDYALTTISKTLTITNAWQDTGISGTNLATGSYMVQISGMTSATGFWTEVMTGVMSWYSGETNSASADEIILHKAGHSDLSGANHIYLRVLRAHRVPLKLQISATGTLASSVYDFKFRRMI